MICGVIEAVLRNFEVVNVIKVETDKVEDPLQFLHQTWKMTKFAGLPSVWSYGAAMDEHFEETDKELDFGSRHIDEKSFDLESLIKRL